MCFNSAFGWAEICFRIPILLESRQVNVTRRLIRASVRYFFAFAPPGLPMVPSGARYANVTSQNIAVHPVVKWAIYVLVCCEPYFIYFTLRHWALRRKPALLCSPPSASCYYQRTHQISVYHTALPCFSCQPWNASYHVCRTRWHRFEAFCCATWL